MTFGKHPMTPLAAVVGGLVAGAVGTVGLDAVQYLRYRRKGGKESALAWEFAPVERLGAGPGAGAGGQARDRGLHPAPAPGPLGVSHQHGDALGLRIVVGSGLRDRGRVAAPAAPGYGLALGATAWLSGYVILPEGGLYKPIWEYDAKTLAGDLAGHLAYGASTGTAFWLFAKIR